MPEKRAQTLLSVDPANMPILYGRNDENLDLNDSFIILDEGQNTTREQMKMFLTRLGFNSRVVLTGDITQVDLPKEKRSGLIHAKDYQNN